MAVDERDREEIFQDYIDDLFDDEKEDEQERSNKVIQAIKERLITHQEVSLDTKWREANDFLQSDPLWKNAQPLERLIAFEEVMKDQDKSEFHQKKL